MARITTYALDSNISLNDKLVGTDADDNSITKNYSIDTLGDGLISLKNIITGAGTLNAIPLWTPDGAKLGSSNINQDVNGNITVGVNLTVVDDLSVQGGIDAENDITVGGSGVFNGPATFNDNNTFYGDTVFEGEANFQYSVTDQAGGPGTAGQVLSSTGNNVQWVDAAQTVEITITDAQLRTIGTAPVEILPVVSGYTYQILGATAQAINAGGLNDQYDWSNQSGVISSRTDQFATLHKVEIPEDELPSGGSGGVSSTYIATPISGSSRVSSKVYVTVTSNLNPIINIGENPSATWKINLTYRLIQL